MTLTAFAGTCGATIIHGLNGLTPATLKRQMASLPTSYAMAITNVGQTQAINALRSAGFQELSSFRNASTGNMLTVWGRTKAAPKPRKANVAQAKTLLQNVISALGD